jgi:hypothetical protein
VIELVVTFLYAFYVAWLIFATFVNWLLKPYIHKSKFTMSTGVSLLYTAMWALVFTLPVAYEVVF